MFDIRPTTRQVVQDLCARFHAYGGANRAMVYAFAVFEDGVPIAAYSWQPPPPGAARSTCPDAPHGVLALSRMVAVPKDQRRLKHISKPLLYQMKHLIDRTRWPVLITYSDEGLGHTGHVYKCSGWTPTERRKVPQFTRDGVRTSTYSCGATSREGLTPIGSAFIQRWEHRVIPPGDTLAFMENAGWVIEPIPGKVWRSGQPAHRVVNIKR